MCRKFSPILYLRHYLNCVVSCSMDKWKGHRVPFIFCTQKLCEENSLFVQWSIRRLKMIKFGLTVQECCDTLLSWNAHITCPNTVVKFTMFDLQPMVVTHTQCESYIIIQNWTNDGSLWMNSKDSVLARSTLCKPAALGNFFFLTSIN